VIFYAGGGMLPPVFYCPDFKKSNGGVSICINFDKQYLVNILDHKLMLADKFADYGIMKRTMLVWTKIRR
jgi:hypothetical protein